MHPAAGLDPGTPHGFGGGYSLSGDYPSQPGGPCASTSTHAAPPSGWRSVDEEHARYERDTANAQDKWKRLDDHPHLMDPFKKPGDANTVPDSGGNPYIEGAAMFLSMTINPGTIFVGTQGSGRWCAAHEAVTVILRNNTNAIAYRVEDVRSSVASEIQRIGAFDDKCILEDLPTATKRLGPYKITLAAAAAHCLMDAEGVTLFHTKNGEVQDEQDLDVELLLPSGRMYALERTEANEALFAARPKKVHDTSRRVRITLSIPPGLGARNTIERAAAMDRLEFTIKRHFGAFGARDIGFFKAQDERTGRNNMNLTAFVNHPKEITRKEFIVTAFKDVKFVNAGMGELTKLMLHRDDLDVANIKQCCFRTACTKQRNDRCDVFYEMQRLHGMIEPPNRAGGKRKLDGPTDAQLSQRTAEQDSIKAKRREAQCRAHTRGRCTNGDKCTAPHTTDPAEIMCNSTVAPGEKAGLSNKTYGYCHLVLKGLKCPYKECIHDGVDPKTDASMDETGE